jgi:hypothetical protein
VGQKVLLYVENLTLPEGLTPKFMSKFVALFPIVERMFKDTYKLEFAPNITMHPTFHVLLLKSLEKYIVARFASNRLGYLSTL